MRKLMLSAVIIGILGCIAESAPLDTEAIEFVRQHEFPKAFRECQGLWYTRWFIGNPDLTPHAEMESGGEWVIFEYKHMTFEIIPLSFSDNDDPNETDLEWIGIVEASGQPGVRAYFAKDQTWVSDAGEMLWGVQLKKRGGQWYVMEGIRNNSGLMPHLSCQEIAKLRK